MKEYKAVYNETLDMVTFYDENGESHLLYVHTKEDHEYLRDKWTDIAYTWVSSVIISFMFPVYFLGIIYLRNNFINSFIESISDVLLFVLIYLVFSVFAWLFFSLGISYIIKSSDFQRKFAAYAKDGKIIQLVAFSFLIMVVLTVFISMIGGGTPS